MESGTGRADATAVLLDSVRSLLRTRSSEQAVGVLIHAVDQLGGEAISARGAPSHSLPLDISLGVGEPLLPVAPVNSSAARLLTELLPELVEDAKVAAERSQHVDRLSQQADTDPLTGLGNRRGLARTRARRVTRVDTIAMVDLDHFKSVNDTHGHDMGDRVLVAFSRALRVHFRTADTVFRLGGEEFLVVLPSTTPAGARVALESLRSRWENERPLPTSFSAGVSAVADGGLDDALLAADKALYAAKEGGRNRIELAPASVASHPTPTARTPR